MIYSDRELREVGLIRTWDGRLLDNRDGFYDDHPDPSAVYDARTSVVVSRGLLDALLACWVEHQKPE